MLNFETIWIIGASDGIGAELARAYADLRELFRQVATPMEGT